MNRIERVRQIAAFAREQIVEVNQRKGYYTDNLGGACGRSSWLLLRLLRQARIFAWIATNPFHYWVAFKYRRRSTVIDITGTQFPDWEAPPVLIEDWNDYIQRVYTGELWIRWSLQTATRSVRTRDRMSSTDVRRLAQIKLPAHLRGASRVV